MDLDLDISRLVGRKIVPITGENIGELSLDDLQLLGEERGELAALDKDAATELRTRLEETPEKNSDSMLLDITVKAADRTGHGPASTSNSNINVNINLAERLSAARKRVAEKATRVIDAVPLALTAE